MKRIISALIALALLSVSSALYAASCYIGVGLGSANLSGISTAREDALSSQYIETSTSVNGKSRPHELFGGCKTPWDTAIEGTIISGLNVTKHTDISGTYQPLDLRVPVFGVDQSLSIGARGISILKYFDVPGRFDPFVRVGVLRAEGHYNARVPIPANGAQKYSVNYRDELSRIAPYVGLGLEFRNNDKKSLFFFRVEERIFARNYKETVFSIGYKF